MKAIEVKQLTKRFGTFTAVDHISFEVEPGEIFGFLGANGAGKTTAMRMLWRPVGPDIRRGPGSRFRCLPGERVHQTEYRIHEPEILPIRRSKGMGEYPSLRRYLRLV